MILHKNVHWKLVQYTNGHLREKKWHLKELLKIQSHIVQNPLNISS